MINKKKDVQTVNLRHKGDSNSATLAKQQLKKSWKQIVTNGNGCRRTG